MKAFSWLTGPLAQWVCVRSLAALSLFLLQHLTPMGAKHHTHPSAVTQPFANVSTFCPFQYILPIIYRSLFLEIIPVGQAVISRPQAFKEMHINCSRTVREE